jgi:hypothetical protein
MFHYRFIRLRRVHLRGMSAYVHDDLKKMIKMQVFLEAAINSATLSLPCHVN